MARWAALLPMSGLAALLAGTADVAAQETGREFETYGISGQEPAWHWELGLAYGHGLDLSSDATSVGDVRFLGIFPRVGRTLGGVLAQDARYRGRFRAVLEVPVLVSLAPSSGYAAGITLLGRYTITNSERVRPFAELGGGPIHLRFNNDRNQSDGISFTLQGGGGVNFFITRVWAVVWRADMHHISNAGLRKPNPGLNDLLFSIGLARHGL